MSLNSNRTSYFFKATSGMALAAYFNKSLNSFATMMKKLPHFTTVKLSQRRKHTHFIVLWPKHPCLP